MLAIARIRSAAQARRELLSTTRGFETPACVSCPRARVTDRQAPFERVTDPRSFCVCRVFCAPAWCYRLKCIPRGPSVPRCVERRRHHTYLITPVDLG